MKTLIFALLISATFQASAECDFLGKKFEDYQTIVVEKSLIYRVSWKGKLKLVCKPFTETQSGWIVVKIEKTDQQKIVSL
jgi:hypothetical protein